MRLFLSIILIFCCTQIFAQDSTTVAFDTIPPYQKDSSLPKFTILQTDSTYFNDHKLPEGKPVVIIYFSPTCGHCQLSAQEFVKSSNRFKDVEFIWASYYSVPEIKTFGQYFSFKAFKNVHIGRDENYAIPSFFRLKFTPYMAVYNKNHQLVATFEKGTDMDNLSKIISELN